MCVCVLRRERERDATREEHVCIYAGHRGQAGILYYIIRKDQREPRGESTAVSSRDVTQGAVPLLSGGTHRQHIHSIRRGGGQVDNAFIYTCTKMPKGGRRRRGTRLGIYIFEKKIHLLLNI